MGCFSLVVQLLFLLLVLNLVQSIPVNLGDCSNNKNVDLLTISNNLENDESHVVSKKSVAGPFNSESRVNGNNQDNAPDATTPSNSFKPPGQLSLPSHTPPNINPIHDVEGNGLDDHYYNNGPMPSNLPMCYPSWEMIPHISVLPPVHTTQIHGMSPLQLDYSYYGLDSLHPIFYPMYGRIDRAPRSNIDDVIEELNHEAMMNNILPISPSASARHVGLVTEAQRPYQASVPLQSFGKPEYAAYPSDYNQLYSVPLLLNCNPNLVHGVLPTNLYQPFYRK